MIFKRFFERSFITCCILLYSSLCSVGNVVPIDSDPDPSELESDANFSPPTDSSMDYDEISSEDVQSEDIDIKNGTDQPCAGLYDARFSSSGNSTKVEGPMEVIDQYDSYTSLLSEEFYDLDDEYPEQTLDESPPEALLKDDLKSSPGFQFIDDCGCRKKFFYNLEQFTEPRLNSSCSDQGTHYFPDQKVISYSLEKPGAVHQNRTNSIVSSVLENLQRMRRHYPGYSMRIYTDISLDASFCRLLCQNMDLFWCDMRNTIGGDQTKMLFPTWKFLPLGDPSVELFLSRDLSTPINEREAAVVEDWLKLNKTFHLMRDKKKVHNIAMLGGLWGGRNDLLVGDEGDKLRAQMISMSKAPRKLGAKSKNFDQDILSRVIFYPRKRDIVAYDSYHCKQWKKFTMVRPFPVRRNNNSTSTLKTGNRASSPNRFASTSKKRPVNRMTKCPVECRPSYGKDWDYC